MGKVIDSGVKQVSAGAQTAFAIKQDGSLWATGQNNLGQLGDGTKTNQKVYVKVVDSGVEEMCSGNGHSVLLNDKNQLCVTGYNHKGQLGTGDKTMFSVSARSAIRVPVRATPTTAAATANAHVPLRRDPRNAAIAQLA